MRKILSYQLYFFMMLNGLFTSYSYSQINQNNLSLESSAYLLQHAKNPINWQRWDKKLYNTNNTDNKLLVVSIGYSSCHWCHVMEKETFEDSGVASFMNQKFISIKVDREENPEIDNIYMTATQMMTGRGGWPLNVVCLPDGRPIYGGTYHTKEQWLEVLGKIQKVYKNDKKQLYGIAEKVEKGIQEVNHFEYTEEEADYKPQLLQNEIKIWTSQWDMINGGEKQNQKFITPTKFNYIQQYQHLNEDPKIKAYFKNTLENIANSGIVDHLEGGFYRYTVDPEWKIPHFEKMLYDNAQLLSLYANAYKEFKTPLFKSTVYKTFDFLQKRMENTEGGYFSAIDADNEQGEGRYYMFNIDEIKKAAGQDLSMILDYYRIGLDKPIENSFYHLRKTNDFNTFLKKYSITNDQLVKKQKIWESQFEELKEKREFPLTDKKIITSWNAQMVSGLLNSFEAFGDKQFLNQAQRTYSFLRENLISGAELMHTFQANKAKMEANLEDYAFMIRAALGLYQNTGNVDYLEQADELTENAIKNFETTKNPFFTYTKNPVMFSEIISVNDNVIPSANAIMAENLWTLGHLLEKKQYSTKAKKMLDVMTSYFNEGRGSDYSQWAQLITKEAFSYKEVVIVGPEAQNTNREIQQNYLPNALFQISDKPSELPLLKDRFFKKETLIYVCEDKVCLRPSETVVDALKQINN
ncbi:MAG: thioredoxin domain-containing protein [Flavobacteriaceae bacterium]|nr:thioredoxin domain-containing protein [Flavobacteriaceae bacterium]